MQWIKEIETAKSIDDLLTPQSISGRTDFPDYDTLDAMMASALRKLFDRQTHFPKRVRVEEQGAQINDRFLRGTQIAFLIFEHFRSTGSYDGVQGLSDLFSIRLQNDDVQDFDVRWERALSTSDPPAVKNSGRSAQAKITGVCSTSDHIQHRTTKRPFEMEDNLTIMDVECA